MLGAHALVTPSVPRQVWRDGGCSLAGGRCPDLQRVGAGMVEHMGSPRPTHHGPSGLLLSRRIDPASRLSDKNPSSAPAVPHRSPAPTAELREMRVRF